MNFAKFSALTNFKGTLFALPFILAGALLPFSDASFCCKNGFDCLWILPAFMAARISGMAFNQLIDRKIDAKNPRTQNRLLPRGEIKPRTAAVIAWGGLFLFLLFSFQLGNKVAMLSLLAAFLIAIYSYMKRVHASCHFVLGMIHFLGPVMAALVLVPTLSWAAVFLGLTAFCSIVATEIVYSTQDLEFDLQHGLHSVPVKLGKIKAIKLSKTMHVLGVMSLLALAFTAHLGAIFYVAPVVLTVLYLYFYSRKDAAPKYVFFCNVASSLTVLTFLTLDIAWRGLL